jgi:hypothetical protein
MSGRCAAEWIELRQTMPMQAIGVHELARGACRPQLREARRLASARSRAIAGRLLHQHARFTQQPARAGVALEQTTPGLVHGTGILQILLVNGLHVGRVVRIEDVA